MVGYDLRILRPRDNSLVQLVDRQREQARAEGKQLGFLFSAQWCDACGRLDLELGNLHAQAEIADVRILKLIEEEWQTASRLDEFNALRSRWVDQMWSYPLFVIVDASGDKIDDMETARDRLTAKGVEPTLPNWFAELRDSAWQTPAGSNVSKPAAVPGI